MSAPHIDIPIPAPESIRRGVVRLGLGLFAAYLGWIVLGSLPYLPSGLLAMSGIAAATLLLINNSTTWYALWRSAFLAAVFMGLDVLIATAVVGVSPGQSQLVLGLGLLAALASRDRTEAVWALLLWAFMMSAGVLIGPTSAAVRAEYFGQLFFLAVLLYLVSRTWHETRSVWLRSNGLQNTMLAEQATLIDVVERSGLLLARVDTSGHAASGAARWGLWLGLSVPSHKDRTPESLWELYTEESRDKLESELIPAVLERGVSRGKLELTKGAGGRMLDATFVLLEDGALGTLQLDVTQQVHAEAARDHFVNTVSHELRTPLTAVASTLDLLDRGVGGELPAQAHGLIGIARNNTERLVRLVNQLLDLQKVGTQRLTHRLQSARLEELVALSVEGIDATASEAGVALSIQLEEPLPLVAVDEDRIIQVITNLLSNAIRHSPRNGLVNVVLEMQGPGQVACSVIDEGPGVPEEAAERIFEAFEQAGIESAAGATSGTGLGLAISRAIMEEHGGSLKLRRDGSPGAMFTLLLPVEQEQVEPTEDLRPWVLMVEDEELVGRALARLLIEKGYRVDLVRRLDDARSFLVANDIDVLVVDVVLPDGLGHDLIDWLEVSHRRVPVVVMSGVRSASPDSRVYQHLEKPFKASTLVTAVRGAIRGMRSCTAVLVGLTAEQRSKVVTALGEAEVKLHATVDTLAELPLDCPADLVVVAGDSVSRLRAELEPHQRGRLAAAVVLALGAEAAPGSATLLAETRVLPADAEPRELFAAINSLLALKSEQSHA